MVIQMEEKTARPNRIRELRIGMGLSQKSLANMLNVSDTAVQNYEYRKRRIPGNVLIAMSELFNVSIDYILMVTDDPTRHKANNGNIPVLTKDEEELLKCYRQVEPWEKELILSHARMIMLHASK